MSFVESRLDNCIRYELFTGFKSERNLYLWVYTRATTITLLIS